MKSLKQKTLSIMLVFILTFGQVGLPVSLVAAAELPSSPSAPETPDSPDSPDQPSSPDAPETSQTTDTQSTSNPSPTPSPTEEPTPSPAPIVESPEQPEEPILPGGEEEEEAEEETDSETYDSSTSDYSSPSDTGSQTYDGSLGDPQIITGEAGATGAIVNTGNSNYATSPLGYGSGPSVSLTSEGNGADSENTGVLIVDDTSTTDQTNTAGADNSLELSSNSGENSASRNVGETSIDTGDADTSGTIVNALNTNVDGVAVAEFNVLDDQVGDLILDYEAFCIAGCSAWTIDVTNADSGADSENTGTVDLTLNDETTQTNDAILNNELILSANTGDNITNDNTGGDSAITTGDANVSGNVINFVNNNLAGNVIYGVVNIFGDLVGDIILPESLLAQLGYYGSGVDVNIDNSGNGTESTNTGTVDLTQTDNFTQINDATILNNLTLDGTTGGNSTSDNTGGNNSITTGDVDIDATVVNIANTNVIGGTWWIVLINEAGNWFGKILGAPSGQDYFGSEGTQFAVGVDGTVNITNEGNGSGSTNTGTVTADITNTTTQTNTAEITNNIDLSANTGGNSASRNTGGKSEIETGDANIMLNVLNFVNNNFAGGNVVFTVVNVFGTWLGDFVGPGYEKKNNSIAASSNVSNPSSPSGGTTSNTSASPAGGSEVESGVYNADTSGSNSSTSQGAATSNSYSSPATQIAGFTASVGPADTELPGAQMGSEVRKKLRINLAWLLLIIPAAGALFIVNRKLTRMRIS